jgi:hypothetical protein
VDANEFRPDPSKPWPDLSAPGAPITIVALSRLVYRKGTDILALIIPELCQRHPNVNFLIGEPLQRQRGQQPLRLVLPGLQLTCAARGMATPCAYLQAAAASTLW